MKPRFRNFLSLILLFLGPVMVAQTANDAARRMPAIDLFSSDLIAWTDMQAPEPVRQSPQSPRMPDPRPETQPQQNPTPTQPPQPSQPTAAELPQNLSVQSFTGNIGKEGDSYVLRVSDSNSYKLDDQDKAKQ